MADESLLSDDVIRQLVAVGQVDVLVGIPTLNNAATVAGVVQAVQAGLTTHLPRARTLLLNSDGGSQDGTPAIVQQAAADEGGTLTTSHRLRTAHRIVTPYMGPVGKSSALRLIFAAADLLQASAVAVIDAEMMSVTPEWVPALVGPIRREGMDFTSPVYARHPLDSPLVTQLARPVVGGVLGRGVREPLAGEFGCAGRFAAHCLEETAVWESSLAQQGMDVWVLTTALAGGFRVAQSRLGPRVVDPGRPTPELPDLFQQVVGTVFTCLEWHAEAWLSRDASQDVPLTGPTGEIPAAAPIPALAPMADAFARNVHDLQPVLAEFLTVETVASIIAAASVPPRFTDEAWAATVMEFLLAHHRGVMKREHIAQALLPLYLGRTASFLGEHTMSAPSDIDAALGRLCGAFEQARSRLVEGWPRTS